MTENGLSQCRACGIVTGEYCAYMAELSGSVCVNCTKLYAELYPLFRKMITTWEQDLEQNAIVGIHNHNTRPRTTKKLIYAMIRDWCNTENDRRRID